MSDTEGKPAKIGQEIWAAISVVFCVGVILVFFFILCCAYRRHRRIRDMNDMLFAAAPRDRSKAFVVDNGEISS